MVAPSKVRPMTFAGRVPKGTTNLELAKAFLERFRENDLKAVQDFGGSNFEVTFRNKAAVDRFLADSATIKVKNADIRFEYRGLRTVTVRVLEYPADASDKVLSRALEVYGKVLGISDDNLTGLRIESGNRRARMELRTPVPNITDVDGHVVRCEYDGCVRLCRKCRLPGHERKTCSTPWCARCQQWGHPTCDAPCKRCGGDHPPHLCKQRLYSEATTRTSVPQVAPPTAVSAEGPGAPAPVTTDKGEQGKAIMAAPGEVEVVENSEKKAPESVEALPTASEKPAQAAATQVATQKEATPVKAPLKASNKPRAKTPVQKQKEPKRVEAPRSASVKPAPRAKTPVQTQKRVPAQKKEEVRPSSPKQAAKPVAPSPRGGEKEPSPPVVKGRGRSPRRRKRGGSRARAAAAARARSTSSSGSSCSESASPEHKRLAATAVVDDDSSSSTTVEDSEMSAGSPTPCTFCKSVACDCSELSDASYASTPLSPVAGESVA